MSFQKYLFNLFPREIRTTDSFKDPNDQGLLERYMNIFETELDQEFVPFIDAFISNVYALQVGNSKFASTLLMHLGSPGTPITLTEAQKIIILKYLIPIYQLKGTAKSFELYFSILGYKVKIQEDTPKRSGTYDSLPRYDDGSTYDMDCEQCTFYDILINTTPTPELEANFKPIICFLQPINSKFRKFIHTTFIEDTHEFPTGFPQDTQIII